MSNQGIFKKLYSRFKTPIKYALFGIGTGVINFTVYFLGTELADNPNKVLFSLQWWQIVNAIAWILSNSYSFFVNRRYVFKTPQEKKGPLIKEIALFFGVRFISFFISTYIMFIDINKFGLGHQVAKMIGVSVEVVLNYFNCKIFVFKNKKAE